MKGCLLLRIILVILIIKEGVALKTNYITKQIYDKKIKNELNNTHYFVATSTKVLDPKSLEHLENYGQNEISLSLYICNSAEHKQICPPQIKLFLIINSVKIDYNGRENNQQDIMKWISYRVQEYPKRVHSLQELRKYLEDKNQVYCFVDRQGQQLTKKQYVFIGVAKKYHFLHYCSIDVSIANQLKLKEGHLTLIRNDLSYNIDYWSENVHQNNDQLYQIWSNFLIKSCQSDFRLGNKNKTHDLVTFQCDFSLQCEEQLYQIFLEQRKWRVKHPQINFKIHLLPGVTGQKHMGRKNYKDYPLIRFGKAQVRKQIVHQQSGGVLQQTYYDRDLYIQHQPLINQNTIDVLLQLYEQKKLNYMIRDSNIDIRPLDGDQAQFHRQQKKKQEASKQDAVKQDL